jgi:uncharacterized protein (UPF0147 family)
MSSFTDVKEMLLMVKEDQSAPKSLREKIDAMVQLIDSDQDTSLKVNSLQQQLEDISNDVNLPSFVRTQMWSISGALEQIE